MLFLDIDWIAKLDLLRDRMSLNDSQVAAELGLSRSMLAQVRSGHRQLPTKAKLRLLDKLGYALTRGTVLAALSGELTETINEADNRRAQDRASLLACFNFLEDEFDRLGPGARKQFFDLLCALATRPKSALSRGQIIDAVWGPGWIGDHHVDVHIGHLRRKLNDDAAYPRFIRTIRGHGYAMGSG